MTKSKQRVHGFTLVEILVAIAVFSVLSLIVASGLKNIISFQEQSLHRAKQWQEWQWAFLLLSRDVEQALKRHVRNPQGQLEPAFVGSATDFTFTHFGGGAFDIERTRYSASDQTFVRMTSPVLDRVNEKGVTTRILAHDITDVRFEYYSKRFKRFYEAWPLKEDQEQALPDAVRIYATLSHFGKMSQLYVIPASSR